MTTNATAYSIVVLNNVVAILSSSHHKKPRAYPDKNRSPLMAHEAVTQLFEYVPEYNLVVCRTCQHAVWPNHAKSHLQSPRHGMKPRDAQSLADEIQGWPDVIATPDQLRRIRQTVPQLPVYADGLRCRRAADCPYVSRSWGSLRGHWRKAHQYSRAEGRRGGSGKQKMERVASGAAASARPVSCQRFFVNGPCSQYFEVLPHQEAKENDYLYTGRSTYNNHTNHTNDDRDTDHTNPTYNDHDNYVDYSNGDLFNGQIR